MTLSFELARGGSAALLHSDGDRVMLLSSLPSPPGSTLELALAGTTYRLKVRGCRRAAQADEAGRSYRIEGRWLSLSRAERERVKGGG